jgi:hypothetical protein
MSNVVLRSYRTVSFAAVRTAFEGDGWVNWSGLATQLDLATELWFLAARLLGRHRAPFFVAPLATAMAGRT